MKKGLLLICFACILQTIMANPGPNDSISKKIPKKNGTVFYIGAGGLYSSVNVFRNQKDYTYHPGVTTRLYCETPYRLNGDMEYSFMPFFDLPPTWYNLRCSSFDINLHFQAVIVGEHSQFYTVTGISVQQWKGLYTGQNDFSLLRNKLPPNTIYKAKYFGANIGCGGEWDLGDVYLFLEFKYRLSNTDAGFGLSDAIYSAGLKVRTLEINRRLFRKPGQKYHWF